MPYLNARPLHWTIREPVTFLEPNVPLAELAEGRLHAGLVPIYTILKTPTLFHIADGYAIGSLNIVYSVVLVPQHPRRAAQDRRARSRLADLQPPRARPAAKILPHQRRSTSPPDEPADAQVIIGDPAIAYRQSHPDERYPRSFAIVARVHRPALRLRRVGHPPRRARPKGIARELRAAARARASAGAHQIAQDQFEHRYLYEHLYYHLGAPQKSAIDQFAADLVEIGLLANRPELSYI